MDDLRGSASERLSQLDAIAANGDVPNEWLMKHLRSTLGELAEIEPVADAEQDRREDY